MPKSLNILPLTVLAILALAFIMIAVATSPSLVHYVCIAAGTFAAATVIVSISRIPEIVRP